MSKDEQIHVIELYKSFLNSLSFPIQIIQKERSLDLDNYLERFKAIKRKEKEPIYKKQLDTYIRFVNSLVDEYGILSHQFYVVIPYRAKRREDNEAIREQMNNRLGIVERGLGNIGLKTRLLNTFEVLDLHYSSYNFSDAKKQPLTQQTIDLLKTNYF